MRTNCFFPALLWLQLVLQSAVSEMNFLAPPSNITVRMDDMFQVALKWEPIAANYTPKYEVRISALNYSVKNLGSRKQSSWRLPIFYFPLNDYYTVEVRAKYNDMESEWAETSLQLMPGDRRTSVKNVMCVWHYKDYINCTWQPGENTPPSVQYKLLYWEKDSNPGYFNESMQFQDFLRTGTECRDYFPHDGLYLGCKFKYEYTFADLKELMFVVTDTSYSIKPFLYYTEARNIGKLRSPNITYVSEAINNEVYINWTVPSVHKDLISEVLLFFSGSWGEPLKVIDDTSKLIHLPNSEDTWAVKVRVKLSKYVADRSYWSDWSTEWKVRGKNKNTTSFLLLILIPVAVIIMAVILLVYLKRLKILIFPPIPNPGKRFQNDLQRWLKSERPTNVCDEPEKEDISPVSLLEA
ncbi:interleukin-13 receptor subunit alpha-1-like [Anomaloglossus baeobatrachus]|uniref:interleukin-13 receptor subunit alpha-1-like n=1 Tax=Anomaloglossus baeobatrachus TaxID=238106 RepID=UPI003F505E19